MPAKLVDKHKRAALRRVHDLDYFRSRGRRPLARTRVRHLRAANTKAPGFDSRKSIRQSNRRRHSSPSRSRMKEKLPALESVAEVNTTVSHFFKQLVFK